MLGVILTTCGLVVATVGTWRGYANARAAVGSLAADGDPTRAVLEAARPILARARVRRFVRPMIIAVLWLALAMYGLLMPSLGGAVT